MRCRLIFSSAMAAFCWAAAMPAMHAATPVAPPFANRTQASFAAFADRLNLFGRWQKHSKWGDVWRPDAGPRFRPYFYGYWEYTSDHGWFWVSNEPFGDIVYHYGRWIFDTDQGWLWVPGYVWGPSWVTWREGEGVVGWLPMPPRYADFEGGANGTTIPAPASDGTYGYQTLYGRNFAGAGFFDLWTFVRSEDFAQSNRRRYITSRAEVENLFRDSQDRTSYRNEEDRIADRSLDLAKIEGERKRPFAAKPASLLLRRGLLPLPVSAGQDIARREQDRPEPRVLPRPAPERIRPDSRETRRALTALPPHGAAPLAPLYPGLNPSLPPSDPLAAMQRRSATIGTAPPLSALAPMPLAPNPALPGTAGMGGPPIRPGGEFRYGGLTPLNIPRTDQAAGFPPIPMPMGVPPPLHAAP